MEEEWIGEWEQREVWGEKLGGEEERETWPGCKTSK